MGWFFSFFPKKNSPIFAGLFAVQSRNSVVWVFQRKNSPYEPSKVSGAGDVDKKTTGWDVLLEVRI